MSSEDKYTAKAREIVEIGHPYAIEIEAELVSAIAQALREASEPQVMSDGEIENLAHHEYEILPDEHPDYGKNYREGFQAGFKECMKERAVMELGKLWPSENQVRDYFQWSKDVKITTPLQAFEVINWLKERLGVK